MHHLLLKTLFSSSAKCKYCITCFINKYATPVISFIHHIRGQFDWTNIPTFSIRSPRVPRDLLAVTPFPVPQGTRIIFEISPGFDNLINTLCFLFHASMYSGKFCVLFSRGLGLERTILMVGSMSTSTTKKTLKYNTYRKEIESFVFGKRHGEGNVI